MQRELIEMLDKMVKYFDGIPSDTYYYRQTCAILNEAEKLVEKAKNSVKEPAVPMSESQRADMICAVAALCTGTSSRTVAATAIEWVERHYGITTPAATSQEPGKCAQCKKPYRKGANTEGCPKCAPGVVVPESEFQKPISAPSQPVNRPQNCGTSFCSCIECVCEPEPVTLTDEDILRCAALTLGEQHVENCGLGDIKEFASAIIAALREKEGK